MDSQGGKNLSEASYTNLLEPPFDLQLQKVEVEWLGWFLKTMGFDKKILSLIEKVNKNCQLPLNRLYEKTILRNHEYKEGVLKEVDSQIH